MLEIIRMIKNLEHYIYIYIIILMISKLFIYTIYLLILQYIHSHYSQYYLLILMNGSLFLTIL